MTGRVFHNGTWMAAGWPARIESAQRIKTYRINGIEYARIPYGAEKDEWPDEPCHDCGALKGQFHVELVCDVEECPACRHQVIGFACHYEGDDQSARTT